MWLCNVNGECIKIEEINTFSVGVLRNQYLEIRFPNLKVLKHSS